MAWSWCVVSFVPFAPAGEYPLPEAEKLVLSRRDIRIVRVLLHFEADGGQAPA